MFNSKMPSADELPSSASLMKSTAIAFAVASGLLITVVLPAEYGVDPTGVGGVLGLTQMGEIKQQLAREAEADRQRDAARQSGVQPVASAAPAVSEPAPQTGVDPARLEEPADPVAQSTSAHTSADAEAPVWRDSLSVTLEPGQASEVKLTMRAGQVVRYVWSTDQAGLNSDLHGDNANDDFISYRQGRNEPGVEDQFTAAFDGSHGWFWRNRADTTVTVTLQVSGEYSEMVKVF